MSHVRKVISLWVPSDPALFDAMVEMFQANGAEVDDTCTVSVYGKLITVWFPLRDVYELELSEKMGSFLPRRADPAPSKPTCRAFSTAHGRCARKAEAPTSGHSPVVAGFCAEHSAEVWRHVYLGIGFGLPRPAGPPDPPDPVFEAAQALYRGAAVRYACDGETMRDVAERMLRLLTGR